MLVIRDSGIQCWDDTYQEEFLEKCGHLPFSMLGLEQAGQIMGTKISITIEDNVGSGHANRLTCHGSFPELDSCGAKIGYPKSEKWKNWIWNGNDELTYRNHDRLKTFFVDCVDNLKAIALWEEEKDLSSCLTYLYRVG